MLTPEIPGCRQPTPALRTRSTVLLVAELAAYLEASETTLDQDVRDVVTGLPPFVDCARRLSADPVDVFAQASAGRSDAMTELADGFARRTDIELGAWDWELVQLADGPCYRLVNEVSEQEFRKWFDQNIPRDIPER